MRLADARVDVSEDARLRRDVGAVSSHIVGCERIGWLQPAAANA